MLVPVIKIEDKKSGIQRIFGTDHHDRLVIEDGSIHYVNIQCMCGTRYEPDHYGFVGSMDCELGIIVEMMEPNKYIEMMKKLEREHQENERKLKELLSKKWGCDSEDIEIMS